MKSKVLVALAATLALSACTTTDPYTGQSRLSNTAGGGMDKNCVAFLNRIASEQQHVGGDAFEHGCCCDLFIDIVGKGNQRVGVH